MFPFSPVALFGNIAGKELDLARCRFEGLAFFHLGIPSGEGFLKFIAVDERPLCELFPGRHLNSKVAPRHHYRIAGLDDLVDVLDGFTVLDL